MADFPSMQVNTEPSPGNMKERRRFTRFKPKNGTMAVSSHALGPVINISMGGLSYRYMDDEISVQEQSYLGIFLGADNFLVDKIKSRVVTDRLLERGSSFIQTRTRQRSVQFLELTEEQREKLQNFILHNTRGVA